MTYQTMLSSDGMVALPENLMEALGIRAGDILSVGLSGSRIVLARDEGRAAAAARLRDLLKDYPVEQFLADRKADTGE